MEEFVGQDPGTNSLPSPEPINKRPRLGLETETSETDSSNLVPQVESVAALERKMEGRFAKLETQPTMLQSTLLEQMSHTSAHKQHYVRSLAGILQKDIGFFKDVVKCKNVGSEQVLNSIIEFNKSLVKAMEDNVHK